MHKQSLIILLLPFLLVSCSGLGAKKNKDIVELTPKLSLESDEAILLGSNNKSLILPPEMFKNKQSNMAKHQIIAKPVFSKGVLYTIDEKGIVSAFSIKNKVVLWSRNISSNQSNHYIGGGILCNNGKLYVTYGSRFIVVLNSDSGNEVIRKEMPDIIRTPPILVNDKMMVVQTVSNQVFAVDLNNLALIWQHEGFVETLSSSYHVAPIVENEKVIINYNSGQIVALDVNNGQLLWSNDLSDQKNIGIPNYETASILCDPVINYPYLYLASSAGKIVKFDINNGNIIWQIKAEDIQSMTLAGNSLFATNNALQFVVIATHSGKIKFVSDLKEDQKTKRIKANTFLPPIISQTNNNDWSVNIISSKGQLYSFKLENNGKLVSTPLITKIPTKILYSGITCCNEIYFTTEKNIILGESKK